MASRLVDKVWFNMVALAIYYFIVPFILAWGSFSIIKYLTGYSNNELFSVAQALIILSYVLVFSCHKFFFTERKKG